MVIQVIEHVLKIAPNVPAVGSVAHRNYNQVTIKLKYMNTEKTEQNQGNDANRLLCIGLNDAAKQIHEDAKRKGFWDSERETGTLLMLMVSELAEALEADRKNKHAKLEDFNLCQNINQANHTIGAQDFDVVSFQDMIKDTFEDELADTVIRILDLCGARGIDIEKHINQKLTYNRTRARMHGKAY